jgi:hypothetical protein
VEDQLRKEFQAFQKGAAHRQGLTVLQRCEQEMRENPDAPRPNNRLWKQKAMEKLAAKHEKEYKSGSFEVSMFLVTKLLDIVAPRLTVQVVFGLSRIRWVLQCSKPLVSDWVTNSTI